MFYKENLVQDFEVESFGSGWARERECGNVDDKSYITLYDIVLKEIFFMGIEYSNQKVSAGKMHISLRMAIKSSNIKILVWL